MFLIFRSLLSSKDPTNELHLFLGFAAAVVFLGLSVYTVVVLGKDFDPITFGTGFCTLLAGVGLAGVGAGFQRKAQDNVAPPQE